MNRLQVKAFWMCIQLVFVHECTFSLHKIAGDLLHLLILSWEKIILWHTNVGFHSVNTVSRSLPYQLSLSFSVAILVSSTLTLHMFVYCICVDECL